MDNLHALSEIRRTYFVADLHLDSAHPDICRQFLAFLASCNSQVDGLYILGDFFEAWVGDDINTPFTQQIKDALRATTAKGVNVYVQHGNRDFLLGKQFFADTGCRLLPDEYCIDLYGQKVLLMHGDTLCTADKAYQHMRKIVRNPLVKAIFLGLPLKWRLKIAEGMRAKSRQYTQASLPTIMDVESKTVDSVMQKHDTQFLIHGHTHQPQQHRFQLKQQAAERIVMAAWHNHGSVFVWEETGKRYYVDLG